MSRTLLYDVERFLFIPLAQEQDDGECCGEVEQIADAGNALPVHDIEFHLAERRGNLVL